MNSYVPSLYDGSQRQALQNHRSPFWNNFQHWVETKLEEHPGLYKFLQRHEDAVVGVNKVLENADVRLYGALRAEAGAGMMVLGSMGGPVGVPLMYLGADNVQAGTYQFLTAKETQTLTTNQLQSHLHLSDTQAELVELGLSAGAGGLAVSGERVGKFLGNSRFTMFGSRSSTSMASLPIEVVPNSTPLRAHIEANIAQTSKGIESSNFGEFSRRAEAFEFYSKNGFTSNDIFDHIRGIDFSQPVNRVTINVGDEVVQYMFPKQERIGNYFTTPGTAGDKLGIYTFGRSPVLFKAQRDISALRSTTAPMIDDYSMARYGWHIETNGGATQYFSTAKDAWLRIEP